jgi:hypothetical protein
MYKVSTTSRINPNPTYNAGFICNQPINIQDIETDDILLYTNEQWVNSPASSLTGSTGPTGPAGADVIINGVIQGSGTATLPSLRFLNDQDTGFYLRNPNELAITCNTNPVFYWTTTNSNSLNPVTIDTTSTEALLVRKEGDTADVVTINTSNTTSTSTTTGALVVNGGIGVSGTAYINSLNTTSITGSTLTLNPQQLLLNKQHAIRLSLTSNFSVAAATSTNILWSNVVYNNGFTYTAPNASVTIPVNGYYLVSVTYEFNAAVATVLTLQITHLAAWGITDRQGSSLSIFSCQLPVLLRGQAGAGLTCVIVSTSACVLKGGTPGNTSVSIVRLF